MADFYKSIGKTLKNEGGFVDHPSDPGGATNKGITIKTFEKYAREHLGIDPTIDNLKNLTDGQASIIYQKEYWNRIKGDEIKDQDTAGFIFDFRVQSGGAVRQIQKLLKDLGYRIIVDGKMGPKTTKALNDCHKENLLDKLKDQRRNYYQNLIKKNPKLKVFEKGWMKRIDGFEKSKSNTKDYFERIKSLKISSDFGFPGNN